MEKLILVFLGGGLGAVARYGAGVAAERTLGAGWPWGTLAVNVIGGLLMGVLWAFVEAGGADRSRLLLGVGVLGGFTTFSAFSLDVVRMLEKGRWGDAGLYAGLSVLLSVGALALALVVTRRVFA